MGRQESRSTEEYWRPVSAEQKASGLTEAAFSVQRGFSKNSFCIWQKRLRGKKGAAGVDGETIRQYAANLETNVSELHARLRAGQYKAPQVRRVEIPKGQGKVRMLGIPTVEGRLLQAAVAQILDAIYGPIFLDCSFGYRLERSDLVALRCLRSHLRATKSCKVLTNSASNLARC